MVCYVRCFVCVCTVVMGYEGSSGISVTTARQVGCTRRREGLDDKQTFNKLQRLLIWDWRLCAKRDDTHGINHDDVL